MTGPAMFANWKTPSNAPSLSKAAPKFLSRSFPIVWREPPHASGSALSESQGVQIPAEGLDFERVIAETEKRYLQVALEKSGGVRTQAAEILKISYRSFRHYAKKHAL